VRFIIDAARQGFIGHVALDTTLQGLAALAGLSVVITTFALRGLRHAND